MRETLPEAVELLLELTDQARDPTGSPGPRGTSAHPGTGVDHELPAVREMEQGAAQRPDDHDPRGHRPTASPSPRRSNARTSGTPRCARDRPRSTLPSNRVTRRETRGSARAASRSHSRRPGTPRLRARNTPRNRGTGPSETAARETAATFSRPSGTFGTSIPSISTALYRACSACSRGGVRHSQPPTACPGLPAIVLPSADAAATLAPNPGIPVALCLHKPTRRAPSHGRRGGIG
jgi:hypothetical protein